MNRMRSAPAAIICAALATTASAQTILRVRPFTPPGGDGLSWATAFSDLQTALDAAAPMAAGGTDVQLWLSAGTYTPSRRSIPNRARTETFGIL